MCDESQINGKARIVIAIGDLNDKKNVHTFIRGKPEGASINAEFIAHLVVSALRELWPDGLRMHSDQIKHFVSDGVSYMKLAGRLIREEIAPEMLHVTCVTHGLNLVSEDARKGCALTRRFVSLVKMTMANSFIRKESFAKSGSASVAFATASRKAIQLVTKMYDNSEDEIRKLQDALDNPYDESWIALFDSEYGDEFREIHGHVTTNYSGYLSEEERQEVERKVPIPPQPCNTRFGTWLVAVGYYDKHWAHTENFIRNILPGMSKAHGRNAACVDELIKLLDESGDELQDEIHYIHSNFGLLPLFINNSESETISLQEMEHLLKRVEVYLEMAVVKGKKLPKGHDLGGLAQRLRDKFNSVILKNEELEELFDFARTHADDQEFSNRPTTSNPVERVFSTLKWKLGDRRNFNDDNFQQVMELSMNMAQSPTQVAKVIFCINQ